MKLFFAKVRAILFLAWMTGVQVEAIRSMLWMQFRGAAKAIWKVKGSSATRDGA